ncbi:hypothetical protein Poli38472_006633 [Pythium oligandrum]|uniref:Uncharacterized protein n=1 Tax=Pythium oligandrum TaxID=41045 RepID=A0A8K1FFB2_PYTOL|nr:hypothetical protein Poli38472_006633 [Pythium oligandrum]|eukprot:TMW56623.1 hypothetical protein Poli38472_006633 [Pythium oligandrum]
MFHGFDPYTQRTGELPLSRLKLLLKHYDLSVGDVTYRQWEQTLPEGTSAIPLLLFMQACMLWFHEQGLINHYHNWQQSHSIRQSDHQKSRQELGKCHSAPQLLHPFDLLTRRHDTALTFSYDDHVKKPPSPQRTQDEMMASKRNTIIDATQQMRRNTKILSRIESERPLNTKPADTKSIDGASSSSPGKRSTTYDRLHGEKLARHILQRCSTNALAPSTRRRPSVTLIHERERQQQRTLALKRARQQNVETAKAFSASIAMISRHVQNEELRDLRELEMEKQAAIVHERKQLRRLQRAHCLELEREKNIQHQRDVEAMKALAKEEALMLEQFLATRQELVRCGKPTFSLSQSTSTLFAPPPEVLAAKATATTTAQRRRLHTMEKDHLEHMRSIQLLDYVYDKRKAVLDAQRPKADAALVQVDSTPQLPEAQELEILTQDLWQQVLQDCADRADWTPLLPPPNSPPAALRYYGTSRPRILPPFTESTATPSHVSKVP